LKWKVFLKWFLCCHEIEWVLKKFGVMFQVVPLDDGFALQSCLGCYGSNILFFNGKWGYLMENSPKLRFILPFNFFNTQQLSLNVDLGLPNV
jgi:hypothetical protein